MKAVLLLWLIIFSANSMATDWALNNNGTVLNGYDPVAYFEQGMAVKGKSSITAEWQGAFWWFTSVENKEKFLQKPEKWAPEFNGYCANGLSDGHKVHGNPEHWRIIDDKLYVFYSAWGRLQWAVNVDSQIEKAKENWQILKDD